MIVVATGQSTTGKVCPKLCLNEYAEVVQEYPERFAQVALGHNSRAVHEAYAGGAIPVLPALDDYEVSMRKKVVRMKPRKVS